MAVRESQSPICFVTFALLAASAMSLSFVMRVDSPDGSSSTVTAVAQQPSAALADQPTADTLTKETVQPKRRVIVYLKSRHHTMAVYHSADGPRFGLSTADGTELAGDLSEAELHERYPDLFQFYRNSYAGAWAGLSPDRALRPSVERAYSVPSTEFLMDATAH